MIKPYDHSLMICGVNESVKDYGKLYLTQLAPIDVDSGVSTIMRDIFFMQSVCVKECPKKSTDKLVYNTKNNNETSSSDLVKDAYIVKTTSIMDICWPDPSGMDDKQ